MIRIPTMSLNSNIRRICIVDDEAAIRDSLRLLLESYSFAVTDFASPAAFLAAQCHAEFDCLLVDLHMPGMTGLELLELLQSRRITRPAILVTGNYDPTLGERVQKAGIFAVLAKPVSIETLLNQIDRATGAPSDTPDLGKI